MAIKNEQDMARERELDQLLRETRYLAAKATKEKKIEAVKAANRAAVKLRQDLDPRHAKQRIIAAASGEQPAPPERLIEIVDEYIDEFKKTLNEFVAEAPRPGIPEPIRKRQRNSDSKRARIGFAVQTWPADRLLEEATRLTWETAIQRDHHDEVLMDLIPVSEAQEAEAREAGDTALANRWRRLREAMEQVTTYVGDYAAEVFTGGRDALRRDAERYVKALREDLSTPVGGTATGAGDTLINLDERSGSGMKDRLGLPAFDEEFQADTSMENEIIEAGLPGEE